MEYRRRRRDDAVYSVAVDDEAKDMLKVSRRQAAACIVDTYMILCNNLIQQLSKAARTKQLGRFHKQSRPNL